MVDNLYVWSGVTAALAWKVTHEPRLWALAGQTLRLSTQSIRHDGLVGSELRRGSRSLLYHGYYLSGLFILARIVGPTQLQSRAISRLEKIVTLASCAPEKFPSEITQVPMNKNDLATIAVLAAPPKEICGLSSKAGDVYDPLRGGDMRDLSKILGAPSLDLHPDEEGHERLARCA